MKRCNFLPRAIALSGLVLGVFLIAPAAYAGETMILVPADDRYVPAGSQIPERRIHETEMKVKAYKEKMKAARPAQQQESLPEAESAKPEGEKP